MDFNHPNPNLNTKIMPFKQIIHDMPIFKHIKKHIYLLCCWDIYQIHCYIFEVTINYSSDHSLQEVVGLVHSISTKSHTFSLKDFEMALMRTFHKNTEGCSMSDHDPWQWGQWSIHKLKTSTQESRPALIPDFF